MRRWQGEWEAPLEFLVLGPLQVLDTGRPVTIAAPRQRALLAVLLMHSNQVVSTDRLLDLVWGGDDSEVGVSALRYSISKLRDALDPGRESGHEGIISTRPPGYVLQASPGQIDALGFETLLAEGRRVLASDPGSALKLFDEALSLWRGGAYNDFEYEEFARQEILRLEEMHLAAQEDRFDALLALGRGREAVGDMQTLVDAHPRRERLTGSLMLALYRAGRQADALAAFKRLRAELGEGIGIEPSKELVDLEERILLQDESLVGETPPPTAEFLRGYVLRGRIGEGAHGVVWRAAQPGLGREVAIKAIRADLANRAEFVRRFEMEAQLVASLEHPHIVSLFDFWRDPEGAYLVMPYLRGGSLADRLENMSFEPETALRLLEDVGAALTYAHRRGVIHRDVTPNNVLLDDDGNAYLADFGVATLLGEVAVQYVEDTPSAAYLSPELLAGEGGSPASDVFSLGVLTEAMLTDGAVLPAAGEVAARAMAPAPADRYASIDEFLEALADAMGSATEPAATTLELRNPYKGLRAFGEADAPDFFGRDRLVAELEDAIGRHRLVGVVGPSGCGKSSLVRAGLIPKLRRGALPGSERWLITDMYPGSRPFAELESALLQVAVDRPDDLEERLGAGDWEGLVGELLPRNSELLLVVDQFEELFTVTNNAEERRRFLHVLAGLVSDPRHRVRVMATMRADFYDRPLEYPEFAELLRQGLVSVAMPGREAMIDAAVGPARSEGLELEAGLAEAIVGDVVEQPGGLPLLEYALTELFRHRDGNLLTAKGYRLTGGVLGALGTRAEELYQEQLASGQEAVRHVFLRLVTVAEGVEDTRRRILLTELQGLEIDGGTLQSVLDSFAKHRLLTLDRDPESREPTVEVAHEALLGRWKRLRTWIDDRRDDLVLHRRLVASVDEWRASGGQSEYLLTGGRLDHFESLVAETDLAIGAEERAYLAESRRHSDELAARRRRRRQGIMAGFAAAAMVALVLAVFAFASQQRAEEAAASAEEQRDRATAAEAEALGQRDLAQQATDEAERQAQLAKDEAARADEARQQAELESALNRSRVLTAAAIDAIGEDNQLALLLGLEAANVSLEANGEVLPEAADALHRSLRASRLEAAISLDDLPGRTVNLVASSSGLVAVSSTGDTVELRSSDDIGTVVATLGGPLEGAAATHASVPAFAPDGSSLAVVGSDGTLHVWDVESGTEIWSHAPDGGGRGGVTYSPDGERLVSGDGSSIVMWDAASGEEIWTVVTGEPVPFPAFSPDGNRLAFGTWGAKGLTVLDAASGDELAGLVAPGGVGGLLWSPDGTRLFVGLETSDIHVVDAVGSGVDDEWEDAVVDTWEGHSATPMAIAIDSSGTRLATGADDGTVRVWDLATGGELMVLGAGTGSIDGVAFLPGDQRLVATGSERLLRVYNVSPEGRGEILAAHTGDQVFGVDFSPDGTKLISLTFGGEWNPAGVTVWDIAAGGPQLTIDGLDWASFDGVTFTPDGDGFVVQEWDETQGDDDTVGVGWGPVQLRDATTGRVLMSFAETQGQNRQMPGFSADGSVLATGSTGSFDDLGKEDVTSTASIHDAATGELLHRLDHSDWAVSAVAPSPNGDRLATATCEKGIVTVWDTASEAILWSTDDPNCYAGIAYSPDGSYVVAAGLFHAPTVWDAETGEKRFDIVGHNGGAYSIEISSDGSTIASAGIDGSVLLVDSSTGEVLAAIQVADVGLGDVDFSPDGETLAVATIDGALYVFALDSERLVDLARSRTLRAFTRAECDAYSIESCPLEE